jgi:hypothetical protein
MLSSLGKQSIYHNKHLRDYVLKSTNDSIEKIKMKNEFKNNINLDYLSNNLTYSHNKNNIVFLPFLFFSIYFTFLYSNKKN